MEWLNDLIKRHPHLGLLPAAAIGVFSFLTNLLVALSDGQLDGNEIHQLLSGANGLETLMILIVIIALRIKSNNK